LSGDEKRFVGDSLTPESLRLTKTIYLRHLMYMSPDNQPQNNLENSVAPEAAITREAKIAELKEKIAAAQRGYELAIKLSDVDRGMEMSNRRQELEATLQALEAEIGEIISLDFTSKESANVDSENKWSDVADFDAALGKFDPTTAKNAKQEDQGFKRI
jgi:hypothetical protein